MANYDISEAIIKIRKAGAKAVRAVPMEGQNVNTGSYMIEVKSGESWSSIVSGLPNKKTAEDIISQATNRTILG